MAVVEFNLKESLRYPVLYVLSKSSEVMDKVKEIYNENKSFYKESIRNHSIENRLMMGIQANYKWNVQILDAILREIEQEENSNHKKSEELIVNLAKMSFNRIVQYAENNQYNPIAFNKYIELREPNISNIDTTYYGYLYLYLSMLKEDFNFPDSPVTRVISENIYLLTLSPQNWEKGYELSEKEKIDALNLYQQLTGSKWRGQAPIFIYDIINDIEIEAVKKNPKVEKLINTTGNTRLGYKLPYLKEVRMGMSVIQIAGKDNITFLEGLMMTKENWYELYYLLLDATKTKGIPKEEYPNWMATILPMYAYSLAYRKLEEAYMDANLSSDKEELEVLEESLLNEKNQLTAKKEQIQSQEDNYKMVFEEKEQKFQERERELLLQIKRLESEKEKMKERTAMMPAMEDALFSNTDVEESEEDVNIIEKAQSYAEGKRMVLIGGHGSFHKRMKDTFQDIYIIPPENVTMGEKQVEEADIVLYVATYNNHKQFQRLSPLFNPSQQLIFLNKISSVERVSRKLLNMEL